MADVEPRTEGRGLARVVTGVPGLDEVTAGGFVRGELYLVGGRPGTGKTTLGNQIAYAHVGAGGAALFVTTLTEPHDLMLAHLSGFRFFDPARVANGVWYLSVFDTLRARGLGAALDQMRTEVQRRNATLLIVDRAGFFRTFASF